jgi:long-chain acyl-CoA synthetase
MERTINEVFRNRAARFGQRTAVEKKLRGRWEGATWAEYYQRSGAVGLGLYGRGIRRGDRVAILSENRLEWLYTDMGVLGIGACLVPLYPTLAPDEIAYILSNAGARAVVVENEAQLEKILLAREECPDLEWAFLIDDYKDGGMPRSWVSSFRELMEDGMKVSGSDPNLFQSLSSAVEPSDLATIVYTSGTTGVPKGAMITHGNIMAVVEALDLIRPRYADETDSTVPFLPLSHVFERIAGHFYGMFVGITASYAESIETLVVDIQEKRPTLILAVPRVCEKVYQRITAKVAEQPLWRRKVFGWGQAIGNELVRAREEGGNASPLLRLKYRIAYALIFKKLKEALGGRVRWMTASGAPTAPEIIRFFNAAGIKVIEGYGMTECTAPATMSTLDSYRIGTVGKPLPGVEIRIAQDGEVLVKGGNVFAGYWAMARETREAFTEDGFLKTGDIGEITGDGFLKIVDRKKDLIITSGGKNIAPQKIENLFKSDPLFEQVIVLGDRQKFLTALFNLSREEALRFAQLKNIKATDFEDLVKDEEFLNALKGRVDEINSKLARFETIKRFAIIIRPFSKESGELTATMKVKRKVVRERFKDLIEEMYRDDAPGVRVL